MTDCPSGDGSEDIETRRMLHNVLTNVTMCDTPQENARDMPDLIQHLRSMSLKNHRDIRQLHQDAVDLFTRAGQVLQLYGGIVMTGSNGVPLALTADEQSMEAKEMLLMKSFGLFKNPSEWEPLSQKDRRRCRLAWIVACYIRRYATTWFEHRCFEKTRSMHKEREKYEKLKGNVTYVLAFFEDDSHMSDVSGLHDSALEMAQASWDESVKTMADVSATEDRPNPDRADSAFVANGTFESVMVVGASTALHKPTAADGAGKQQRIDATFQLSKPCKPSQRTLQEEQDPFDLASMVGDWQQTRSQAENKE